MFSFIQSGQFSEDMIPTVGFNMRKVTKGNVTIKVCDLAQLQIFLFFSLLFTYLFVLLMNMFQKNVNQLFFSFSHKSKCLS